ncbi:hypothetical protein J1N35_008333 [Gossypium stocksii]|uniref:Uncharacterized protein n=1 Tax=Gossypium stocksii TaxID=47602 RepID=A0A9D3WAU6_9ROSI|nr:hypothetical protein J1N35_008333 [Gossypium stocksii]
MSVRVSMLDMGKKCMTNPWATNVVLRNEEEEDSAILEQHRIKMTDHTKPSTIVVVALGSPIASSPSVPHASSPTVVHVSSSPIVPTNSPSAGPSSYPPTTEEPSNKGLFDTIIVHGVAGAPIKFVAIGGNIGELFPWHEHASTREFLYSPNDVTNHLKISLPEVAKECMCSAGSCNGVKKPSL